MFNFIRWVFAQTVVASKPEPSKKEIDYVAEKIIQAIDGQTFDDGDGNLYQAKIITMEELERLIDSGSLEED